MCEKIEKRSVKLKASKLRVSKLKAQDMDHIKMSTNVVSFITHHSQHEQSCNQICIVSL